MKFDLIIGLPAKNEEIGICKSIQSLIKAVVFAGVKNYKIIVCINSSTDNTYNVVKKFIKDSKKDNCLLIKSEPGIINAQRKIVSCFSSNFYIFADADIEIEKRAIKLLLEELHKNSNTIVAYAKTISFIRPKRYKFLAERISLLYDSQKLLSPREYIHGRLFITRDWHVPSNKKMLKIVSKKWSNKKLLKYCNKNIFLAVDDIFMTSYIMDKYGLGAIKQVESANCYSWPVTNFFDWYRIYRRRNIEMEKMKCWFPEYNYLWPHLNRHTDYSKWLKANLQDKVIWIMYLVMKNIFFCCLKFELFMLKFSFYTPSIQWKVAKSTKNRV